MYSPGWPTGMPAMARLEAGAKERAIAAEKARADEANQGQERHHRPAPLLLGGGLADLLSMPKVLSKTVLEAVGAPKGLIEAQQGLMRYTTLGGGGGCVGLVRRKEAGHRESFLKDQETGEEFINFGAASLEDPPTGGRTLNMVALRPRPLLLSWPSPTSAVARPPAVAAANPKIGRLAKLVRRSGITRRAPPL